MKISFKLFASLQEYLPPEARREGLALEIPDGASPLLVLKHYGVPSEDVHLVLVNGVYVPPSDRDRPLAEGDELAVWPAVAGG